MNMEKMDMKTNFTWQQLALWLVLFVIGIELGIQRLPYMMNVFYFVSLFYVRFLQFVVYPLLVLSIIITLGELGWRRCFGRMFKFSLFYSFLFALIASVAGVIFFKLFQPAVLNDPEREKTGMELLVERELVDPGTFFENFFAFIPGRSGGLIAFIPLVAIILGVALAKMPKTENAASLLRGLRGLQEVFFCLLKFILWAMPLGVLACGGLFSAALCGNEMLFAFLGKYAAVLFVGYLFQFFVVVPIVLLLNRINPYQVFLKMFPALLLSLFTKSAIINLPMTLVFAENQLKAKKGVSRIVLPVCSFINTNCCAAFFIVTILFWLQHTGYNPGFYMLAGLVLLSVFIALISAAVPLGCFMLTLLVGLKLGAPIEFMGIILPVYSLCLMSEACVQVWADSSICAIADKKITQEELT